jgi:hypothetical protein
MILEIFSLAEPSVCFVCFWWHISDFIHITAIFESDDLEALFERAILRIRNGMECKGMVGWKHGIDGLDGHSFDV